MSQFNFIKTEYDSVGGILLVSLSRLKARESKNMGRSGQMWRIPGCVLSQATRLEWRKAYYSE